MIRTKGEAGTGNVVEAVRHMRAMNRRFASWSASRPRKSWVLPRPTVCPTNWRWRSGHWAGCRWSTLRPAASPPRRRAH